MGRISRSKYLLLLLAVVFFLGTYSGNYSLFAQQSFAIYEAEAGDMEGMNLSTSREGYSGTGYVESRNNIYGTLLFNVNVREGGVYNLSIRYASEFEDSVCYTYLKGQNSQKVMLKQSSSFSELSVGAVTLRSGLNEVKITYCSGTVDFDYIKFSEATVGLPTPSADVKPTATPIPSTSTSPSPPLSSPSVKPSPSAEPSPLTGYKLSGYIMPDFDYSAGSAPRVQSGFTVSISDTSLSALTDASGKFVIDKVQYCASGYTLKIYKTGYLFREIKNVVVKGNVEISTIYNPILLWGGDIPYAGFQDNAININDIVLIANRYGTINGDARFVDDYDLTKDNAIGLADIMVAVKHFNSSSKSYPSIW